MKRKFIPILLIPLGAVLIFAGCMLVQRIYDMLIFAALSECTLPQEKKFEIEKMKIDGCKVWEMKNVYENNGDYWFAEMQDGKKIVNRFYMVNKEVKDVDDFAAKFISLMKEEFSSDEIVIKYFIYRESKKLPKYWMPVWKRPYPDALFMHEDDLLFTITTDANKNILNVDISSSKNTPPDKVSKMDCGLSNYLISVNKSKEFYYGTEWSETVCIKK